MKILLLEDSEERIKKFKQNFIGCQLDITKDPNESIRWVSEKEYDYIFIDHDLEDSHYVVDTTSNETTGLALGEFLGKNPQLSPSASIIIHSLNPTGSERIKNACINRNPVCIPYVYLWERLSIR